MLKIRLARHGAKNKPFYRLVLAEASSPRDGKFIETLGTFNPLILKERTERTKINYERILHWIARGAKPTERVSHLLHIDKNIDFTSKKLRKYDDLRAQKEERLRSREGIKTVSSSPKDLNYKEESTN